MHDPLVTFENPVIFLGGGEFDQTLLDEALTICDEIVAADGGAGRALDAGRVPAAVIGDLDSLDARARAGIPPGRIHRVPEQDTTDFEKCLLRTRAPLALAVGFTGARIDHALAVMNALVVHHSQPCIVLGPSDLAFHVPEEFVVDLEAGTRVSLFPMRALTGRSEGLRWPIDGLDLAPGGRVGTSNEATGGRMRLRFDASGALVILPRDLLAAAVAALLPGHGLTGDRTGR